MTDDLFKRATSNDKLTDAEATELLYALLAERYQGDGWALLREVRGGPGFDGTAVQRLDAVAAGLWKSSGLGLLVFELKASRSDFMREAAKPGKRSLAESVGAECWYVTMPGVCRPDEVPAAWGLIERRGAQLVRLKAATRRDVAPPLGFTLGLLRRAAQAETGQRDDDGLSRRALPVRLFRYAGKAMTAEDFQEALREAHGADLERERVRMGHDMERVERADQVAQDAHAKVAAVAEALGLPVWELRDVETAARTARALSSGLSAEDLASLRNVVGTLTRLERDIAHQRALLSGLSALTDKE